MNHRDRRDFREKYTFPLRPLWFLWLMIMFSACIPVQTSSLVNATPGAGAVITQDAYRNDLFSLSYPAGWRAVTSPAGAPASVTFVAPGDCALVVVSSAPIDAPPTAPSCDQPNIQTVERAITLGDTAISLAGSAPASDWDNFMGAVDRIASSLRAGA